MALAMTALGATSCSNEEGLRPDIQTGEKTNMTVSVSMEELDAETRSTMTDENGSLKFAWKKGDKLLVTGGTGSNFQHLGVLTLDDNSDGQANGIFNGNDITILGKTAIYHYFYLGNGAIEKNASEYTANIPASELTDVSLGNNDIMKASAEMSYGGDGLSGKVSLKRAFGFLTLTVNLPSNVTAPTGGATLTLSGTGITSKAKIDLTNADAAVTNQGTTSNAVTLTIPAGQSSKKFYLNILPGTLSNLTVTTEINGETYSATVLKDVSKTTVANKNYKATFNLEAEDNGEIKWIDLGLPSGTLWADRNLGATKPEEAGEYFCFGGLEHLKLNPEYDFMRDSYDTSVYTYNYGTVGYNILNNLKRLGILKGSSNNFYEMERLKGSDLDVATVRYNNNSQYYTADTFAFIELINNCTFSRKSMNGKPGWEAKASNGNSIFFPATGYYSSNKQLLGTNDVVLRLDVLACSGEDASFYMLFSDSWDKSLNNAGAQGYWNMFAPVRPVKSNN